MISTVIFDLGRVLLEFRPTEYLTQKFKAPLIVKELMKNIFYSVEWVALDRGTISFEDAVSRMVHNCPEYRDEIVNCMENWEEMMLPIEESVAVLKEVKNKGYKTLILSNFHRKAFGCVSKKCDFFRYFDGGVISFETGFVKPEEEIYRHLIDKYGIKKEESIFIDDMQKNIDAAKKAGIQAILFENPGQLRKVLSDILL